MFSNVALGYFIRQEKSKFYFYWFLDKPLIDIEHVKHVWRRC